MTPTDLEQIVAAARRYVEAMDVVMATDIPSRADLAEDYNEAQRAFYAALTPWSLPEEARAIAALADRLQELEERLGAATGLLQQVVAALPAPIKMTGRTGVEVPLHEIDVFLAALGPEEGS